MVSFCGTYWLSSTYFIFLRLFRLFLFLSFFLRFFMSSVTCGGTGVRLVILNKSSGVVPRFLSGSLRGELQQTYLAINVTSLVQFGKNLSYIMPLRIICWRISH